MATVWSDAETLKLIEVWGEDTIQAMLEGSKRNKDIYKKIAREMEAAGYAKTGEQCNGKIKKLRLEYKKMKDKRGKTGTGRKDWKFFDAMDSVLGHKPATQPPVMIESGATSSCIADEYIPEEEGDENVTSNCSTCDETDEHSKSRSETPVCDSEKLGCNRKRKKASDKFEKIEGLIDKVVKLQEDSDRNFLTLEEKILQMEERRQKESRELQLQLLSVLSCNQAVNSFQDQYPTTASLLLQGFLCLPIASLKMWTIKIDIINNINVLFINITVVHQNIVLKYSVYLVQHYMYMI